MSESKTSKIHFTSDLHFGHKLAAKIRGFDEDVEAMDEDIVSNWNEKVHSRDRVYCLGDVALGGGPARTLELLNRLNGQIYLLQGNHESLAERPVCRGRFVWIKSTHMLKIKDIESRFSFRGKVRIWLSHYAHRVWPDSHWGSLHLYGHSHGHLPDDPCRLSMDVGIDSIAMRAPVSYEWVLKRMALKKWEWPENRRDEISPFEG